ncbi:5'(3')-deoxyribonucleotidase, mitochondrial [Varanus komodoensis]|uniref:5'(3')-deoxyribonucleotidase, mitochondrial n=1 Tax=Varanus komodoensis TaxID=61221 RepID=UPI001CF7BE04|nr:5'(3')-deoxyribonucleotidase, mitochondrial [Varanus komodoensis]
MEEVRTSHAGLGGLRGSGRASAPKHPLLQAAAREERRKAGPFPQPCWVNYFLLLPPHSSFLVCCVLLDCKPVIVCKLPGGAFLAEELYKNASNQVPPTPQEKAISIWESKNFFVELDPLPGAVEAVKQMAKLEETDVFICTSPIKKYRYCPYEKYAWVEKHLGPEFLEQIVLTRDKTVVSGDLLIDDRPDIIGAERSPSWEHVLFTACHNKHVALPPPRRRLHSWADDWKTILESKRAL